MDDKLNLITGSEGFIGKALQKKIEAERLDKKLYSQLCLDLEKTTSIELRRNWETVFHLAANPDIRTNDFSKDINITRNLLEQLTDFKGTFIFTSSSTVYGNAIHIPTREDDGPFLPISLYGASKLAIEGLVSAYAEKYGFKFKILRLANVVGKGCHGIVPDLIQKLRSDSKYLELFGDGNQRKSYIHIDDCVEKILRSLKTKGQVFNIGNSDSIDVFQVVEIAMKETRIRKEIKFTQGWLGDVKLMQLDCEKLGYPLRSSAASVRDAVRENL